MLISRLPFGGGGEMHGANISVILSDDFVGGKCILTNSDDEIVQEKNISESLSVVFSGIMTPDTYKVIAYIADLSRNNHKSVEIKTDDILNKTIFNIEIFLLKIVTFADGTDEEIQDMLDAHYAGLIEIADYWAVGDERIIHLNSFNSTNTTYYGTKTIEQDATIVIADINHYDLATAVGTRTKQAIVCVFKTALYGSSNSSPTYVDQPYRIQYNNQAYTTSPTFANWETASSRAYINDVFYEQAFSDFIKSNIKAVTIKYKTDASKSTADYVKTVNDKVFALSFTEMSADIASANAQYKGSVGLEGEQLELFKIIASIGLDTRKNVEMHLLSRSRSGKTSSGYYTSISTVINKTLLADAFITYSTGSITGWSEFFVAFCL